jgi:ABC-type molybdenum transport system ATPase subunit/photorepair protein PhrA
MQSVDILRECAVIKTPRLMQMNGIFDVPLSERSVEKWHVDLKLSDVWNVGLIVGPSGSGKTTVARELFGKNIAGAWNWPTDKSVLDGFPADMSIKEIVELLSSVGFSSPPSWVRPFRVLSNGEQFRVNMARTLAEMKDLAVVDEFTSVVDRTVAQIGSAAIQKTVRRRGQKFIAVSCHYDIAEWLEPDWIYQPHVNQLTVGRLLRRPEIKLEIRRVHSSAWQMFRKHHYLDTNLNTSAVCFVAFWHDVPVAFASVLNFPHPKVKGMRREHRTVCLPDYQGVGIGNALSGYVGAMYKALGHRYVSTTSHPGMIRARAKSKDWRVKTVGLHGVGSRTADKGLRKTFAFDRITGSCEYVGAALPVDESRRVWSGE